jgi:hypothetical protein
MDILGDYYLNLIDGIFKKDDIYIGINCGTSENLINKIRINYPNFIIVPENLCINSDASGYQMALSILNKKYDYVVFGHTKGSSYHTIEYSLKYRIYNETFFWGQIDNMIDLLNVNPNVGIVGVDYIFDHEGSPDYINLNEICNFPIKTPFSGFYPNTFYMIKGAVIEFLLKNMNRDFFNKNLETMGFNRYFFESYFPKISSMVGYRPSVIKNNEIQIL